MVKTYGLVGKQISYSFSRGYFSDKFSKEAIASTYVNFDIPVIADIQTVLSNTEIGGLNVTIPYKEQIIPYLDSLDPIAKKIGAVNVIKFDPNGNRIGYNSDYYGFKNSLTPHLHSNIKKALILGTGGASKAIAYALESLGIQYTFVSRNPDEDQLAYHQLDQDIIHDYKLIINCTPIGTHPNTDHYPDIPYEYLTTSHILYDLIYNPETTTFLKKGKEKGATIINGLKMLILQAEKAWEIWNS
ncbi:shikimate dehydrogenase family protein [Aquimarina rhabdastrellae]